MFADVLARLLRSDPGRPLLTYYDLGTGERVELSVTTYANWVAKTASLLAEEHDLERGDRLVVDLPPHWLGPVVLGAAWTIGLAVVADDPADPDDEPDGVVCGPDGLDRWAPRAAALPVLACALRPLGVPFADPLPAGVHDVGVEVWSQPDAFTPWDPPTAADLPLDQWARPDDRRLLSTMNPLADGARGLSALLAGGGSLVLVSGAGSEDPQRLAALAAQERAVLA